MGAHYSMPQPNSFFRSCLGVLADNAAGMYRYDTIWNDANPAQMATLAPTQMHRDVDLMILEADKEGRYTPIAKLRII